MGRIAGEICEKFSSFEWKIEDFSSLSANPGDYYKSPQFELFETKWSLEIYPDGYNQENSGWIAFFLKMEIIQSGKHTVFFKTSIKGLNDKIFASEAHTVEYNEKSHTWGYRKYLNRSEFLKNSNEIAPDGILTISFALTWDRCGEKYDANPTILWETLVFNLKNAFLDQRNCDVVLKVKNEEFPAHRMILEARSKLFQDMIENGNSENQNTVVEVTETEPGVFRSFLLYLYSGDVELSSENACGVYALSRKHNLKDLTKVCVKYMECNLSVETVCDVFLLYEKYEETKIHESAKNFVFENASDVLSSEKWENFEIENAMLATKILKSIILDKLSKTN